MNDPNAQHETGSSNNEPIPLIPGKPVYAVTRGMLRIMGATEEELRKGQDVESVDVMLRTDLDEFLGKEDE
jgi:hypothetical protein